MKTSWSKVRIAYGPSWLRNWAELEWAELVSGQSRSQSLRRHGNEGSGIIHRRKQKNRVPIEKSMRQE